MKICNARGSIYVLRRQFHKELEPETESNGGPEIARPGGPFATRSRERVYTSIVNKGIT